MNPEAQARLNQILAKTPESLNIEEIRFIRARRDYLNKAQLEDFASVLKVKSQTSEKSETVKKNANTK